MGVYVKRTTLSFGLRKKNILFVHLEPLAFYGTVQAEISSLLKELYIASYKETLAFKIMTSMYRIVK